MLNKDGRVAFFADRSLLDLDILPLDEGLRALLPNGGDVEAVVLDEDGREYPVVICSGEGYVTGKGIRDFFARHPGNRFCIRAEEGAERRYCIASWTMPEAIEADALRDPFLSFEPENAQVLEALALGVFEPERRLDLNAQAQGMSAHLGFESLLSPGMVPFDPYLHQVSAVSAVVRRFRGRALLCDEVGLGKTVEAGMVLLEYMLRRMVRKVLILTPPSLAEQWQEEMLRKFTLDFTLYDSEAFRKAGASAWEQFDRVIASIHTAKRQPHADRIGRLYYDMVIVDEAHHLRNRNAMSYKFVDALQKRYILLLTATPVQNDLSELFNLITLLKPGHLSTSYAFTRDFVTRGDKMTPKNLPRLRGLLSEVMIRNRRATVDLKLPRRTARTISVELLPEERELYDSVTDFVRASSQEKGRRGNALTLWTIQQEVSSSAEAALATLGRIAADEDVERLVELGRIVNRQAKLEAALDVISAYGDKLIVFTRFRETQKVLHRMLGEAGLETALFHGQMRRAEKEAEVQRFSETAQVLISTESGGEGRNLQFCNAILNYDLPWNPMRIEQRIGRVHRVGQTRDVNIFNLAARDTIEAHILDILDVKIGMFELVIGEIDMILGNLNDEREFEDIVMDILVSSQSDADLKDRMDALGNQMIAARKEYFRVREYEEKLFGAQGGADADS